MYLLHGIISISTETKKPKVPQIFQFRGLTQKHLEKDMPYIFKSELRKQLAQFK